MTALSAEAYVNAALLTLASRTEFNALDRLATPEKYFVGLAYFDKNLAPVRASAHGAALVSLFRVRNALTHSKVPDQSAMFIPRTQVGNWILAVSEIVGGWHEKGDGSIPAVFGAYASHFADQGRALGDADPEVQLNALADALDASSPFSIHFTTPTGNGEEVTILMEQTELGPARREVLWGTSTESVLDPSTGAMVEKPTRRISKP
jgi:hypothetical protein